LPYRKQPGLGRTPNDGGNGLVGESHFRLSWRGKSKAWMHSAKSTIRQLYAGSEIDKMTMGTRNLRVGDWVEVRSKDDILKTLDHKGQLNGMPFMPEMFAFCGKTFRVYKRAHKTCDTVFPVRGRRVYRAVHLETRCDGGSHGGCQAGCLIFWKEEWLKRVDEPAASVTTAPLTIQRGVRTVVAAAETGESDLRVHAAAFHRTEEKIVYSCQATALPYATTELAWWDLRQYIEDYTSGNVTLTRVLCGSVYSSFYNLSQSGLGLGRPMTWFYDTFHPLWRGTLFPRKAGTIPVGQPTPEVRLNLQPGELVRVKSHEEILQTLNVDSKNRGMAWDAELIPYCGQTFRVLRRVSTIVNERTGELQDLKNSCVVLESVVCQSRYSGCRMFCPRSIYPYWREIWLERASDRSPTHLAAS
jgi:hypothetical protein